MEQATPHGCRRALSPTIGLVLLGVTVVLLAASIGIYVTGIASQQTTPEMTWNTNATVNESQVSTVTFTQQKGDTVDTALLAVQIGNDTQPVSTNVKTDRGTRIVVSFDGTDGYGPNSSVRLVFSPTGSDETTTLVTYELKHASAGSLDSVTAQ
jgi:FlaG/FlaF family flagellin (archaellin)